MKKPSSNIGPGGPTKTIGPPGPSVLSDEAHPARPKILFGPGRAGPGRAGLGWAGPPGRVAHFEVCSNDNPRGTSNSFRT